MGGICCVLDEAALFPLGSCLSDFFSFQFVLFPPLTPLPLHLLFLSFHYPSTPLQTWPRPHSHPHPHPQQPFSSITSAGKMRVVGGLSSLPLNQVFLLIYIALSSSMKGKKKSKNLKAMTSQLTQFSCSPSMSFFLSLTQIFIKKIKCKQTHKVKPLRELLFTHIFPHLLALCPQWFYSHAAPSWVYSEHRRKRVLIGSGKFLISA